MPNLVNPYILGPIVLPASYGPDLVAHWKEDVTVTSSPDVDSWNDETSNNNDATQGTAAAKPHLVAGDANGFDTLDFDGADDFLEVSSTLQSTWQTDFMIWKVIKFADGQPAGSEDYFGMGNASLDDAIVLRLNTDGTLLFFYASDLNDSLAVTDNVIFSNGDTGYAIILCWADFTNNQLRIFVNSKTEEVLDEANNGSTSAVTPANYANVFAPYVGARNDEDSIVSPSDCLYAELGILSNPTTQRKNEIMDYLSNRYNISLT